MRATRISQETPESAGGRFSPEVGTWATHAVLRHVPEADSPRRTAALGMDAAEPPRAKVPTVGMFGNSYWAQRLARTLEGIPLRIRLLYVNEEESLRSWSVRRWLAEAEPWSCDVLHVLGWPTFWNLWLAARLKRVPVLMHWLGSDVLSFLASPRWSRAAGPALNAAVRLHLAVAPHLVGELRTVGIYARHEPLCFASLQDVPVPPLPAKPCVLTMLRPDRFVFYGGTEVLAMARAAPDIRWLVVQHDGQGVPRLPNISYLGEVPDIGALYDRTAVLVRLTRHDGLPQMVLEALSRGRYVVWSQPLPHCRLARSAESALREIRAVLSSPSPNLEGAAWVRRTFDVREQARRLCRLYAAMAGEPCVR